MIKERYLMCVKVWNKRAIDNKKYILVFTLGNGSMLDKPRSNGYVVQKFSTKGGERSKFHLNKTKAIKDYNSDTF